MPKDATIPPLSAELQVELNEAVRDERAAFVTWNNAKEHLRKVQEKILVEAIAVTGAPPLVKKG